MRKAIVAMSLKIYINSLTAATELAKKIASNGSNERIEQIIFPSLGTIYPVAEGLKGTSIKLGAQNVCHIKEGAFTGEISITSIIEMGGTYIEIGHAERRSIFKESDEIINKKVNLAVDNFINPLVCIGENSEEKEANRTKEVLERQIVSSFEGVNKNSLKNIVIAYEPVWAIGKEKAANASYVHEAHGEIRDILVRNYGKDVAEEIRIIYGGSISKDNVFEIINNKNVDGVFIGRFGHDPENYRKILEIVKNTKRW